MMESNRRLTAAELVAVARAYSELMRAAGITPRCYALEREHALEGLLARLAPPAEPPDQTDYQGPSEARNSR